MKLIDRRVAFKDIIVVNSKGNIVAEWQHIDDETSDNFISIFNKVLNAPCEQCSIYEGALEDISHVSGSVL